MRAGGDLQRTVFGLPADGEAPFAPGFLLQAIASHLQTGGVTVVLGSDLRLVNMMVDTLAVFLADDQQRQSRYASPGREADEWYVPDLYLQGVLLGRDGAEFDTAALQQSQLPSTLVRLDEAAVLQTRPRNEYEVMRSELQQAELQQLRDAPAPSADGDDARWRTRSMRHVHGQSALVHALLEEVSAEDSLSMRQALLQHFMHELVCKASCMISLADAVEAAASTPKSAEAVAAMRRSLGLEGAVDYEIVLAVMDRLRPGASRLMLGDPMVLQERFVELLGSF